MINYLIGKPVIYDQELVIMVNGVGYGVKVTNQTLSDCSNKEEVNLHIYTHVKEEIIQLYGFNTLNDKRLFKLLISVSGVGPATSMNILNKGSKQIIEAIQEANVSFFTSVKRVGKKAGQKIIIELKNKLGGVKDLDLTPLNRNESDIFDALVGIGFDENAVSQVIKELELSELPIEKAVQTAIKELGKNK